MRRPAKANPQPNDLLTAYSASKLLGISPRQVRALAMGGQLRPAKFDSGKPLFAAKDVTEFFHQHRAHLRR